MLRLSIVDLIVRMALKEDVGGKDITSSAVLPRNKAVKADIEFKQDGILCGIEVAERVFRIVDESIRFLPVAKDGDSVASGREIAYIEGPAVSVLIAERTALNFLAHLSGIATLTARYVQKTKGTGVKVLDTRKTVPGLRMLDKYAVLTGGGTGHRIGLYDQVLIKDNHLRILRDESLISIVSRARKNTLKKTIIGLEVKNLKELKEALKTAASYVLLDNFSVADVKEAVQMRKAAGGTVPFEVSGGIHLENVRDYAEAGIERISVGALTHSAPALDVSLNIVG